MRAAAFVIGIVAGLASPVLAQDSVNIINPPPPVRAVNLSGPRFGFTSMSDSLIEKLHEREIDIHSPISQFGWQFEKEFYSKAGGLAALNEFVVLAGGLEQGVVLPSVSWLVGLRSAGGAEFGIGPNVTPAGVALAIAGGVTFRSGALNVPMTFAFVPSKDGMRVSMLAGFNFRGRH
jgi:hypothetical protein